MKLNSLRLELKFKLGREILEDWNELLMFKTQQVYYFVILYDPDLGQIAVKWKVEFL